jgi:hypothetical protein
MALQSYHVSALRVSLGINLSEAALLPSKYTYLVVDGDESARKGGLELREFGLVKTYLGALRFDLEPLGARAAIQARDLILEAFEEGTED